MESDIAQRPNTQPNKALHPTAYSPRSLRSFLALVASAFGGG